MKPNQIGRILDLTVRIRKQGKTFNPCFVSPPGLGKSEICQEWAKQHGYQVIDIRTALLESPDLVGFQSTVEIEGVRRTVYSLPEMWPTTGKGVILLDEINRGNTSVMNALMQLLTDRKVFTYKLPEEWIIVSCINPETANYDVNTMDPALKDRLEFFRVEYDKKVFMDYMEDTHWDATLMAWVESNTWVYRPPEEVTTTAGNKYLSPRSLSKLNAALQAGMDKEHELDDYCEMLGDLHGKSFYQFKTNERPVVYEDLLKNEKKALKELAKFCNPESYKTGHVSILFRSLVENAKDVKDDLLHKVCVTVGAEQAMALIREMEYKLEEKDLLNRLGSKYPDFTKYVKNTLKKDEK